MKKKNKEVDCCPICSKNLYISKTYTMRVGIVDINRNHRLIGWACPFCNSEFDNKDNIMYIYGENFEGGRA